MISHSIRCQRDISPFMRSTRTFYHLVHPVLCRFNARNYRNRALLFAAINGHTDLVKKLFSAGASLGASDRTNDSSEYKLRLDGSFTKPGNPILAAVYHSHLATVKALLSENRPGQSYVKPQLRAVLHWALRSQKIEIVDLMLAERADLGPPDNMDTIYEEIWMKQNNALGVAICSGCTNEILEPHPWYEATVQREGQMLQLLFKHGRRPKSDTVLGEIALRSNDPSALARITDPANGGLDIRIHGHPALFTAVEKGHFDMVKYLIARGANPNLRCDYFELSGPYSTVWAAVQARRMDILEFLVTEQGVRPDEQDLQQAVKMEFEEAVAFSTPHDYKDVPEKEDIPSYVAAIKRKMKVKLAPGFDIVTHSSLWCPTSEEEWYFMMRPVPLEWH
ncbi:ankyrin [Aspergillus affinis]|uniref:ankyrin n=1 Tax=Aspergillus affinis TaxID=1070780 RepID=UPI0022FDB343|nr:ankyrin [Aspergillus affinis]KAI9045386.1 ankyrin [Aspergillus affinis]